MGDADEQERPRTAVGLAGVYSWWKKSDGLSTVFYNYGSETLIKYRGLLRQIWGQACIHRQLQRHERACFPYRGVFVFQSKQARHVFQASHPLIHETKSKQNKSPSGYTQEVRIWIWKEKIFGREVGKINRIGRISSIIFLSSSSTSQKEMSGDFMNFYFTGSEILTVCVLIMSTERGSKPETFMALALWVYFPSICAFPDSFSSSNLTLQHCHTPHWLPWRNSPPGLQGTRAYCLWLLYLDENMICWKGSTCFFLSLLLLVALAFFFFLHMSISINRAWHTLFPSSFQEFNCARVRVTLAVCLHVSVAGGRAAPSSPLLPHALARTSNCLLLPGLICHQNTRGEDRQLYYSRRDNAGCADLNTSRHDTLCELQVQLPVTAWAKVRPQLFATVWISVNKVPVIKISASATS